LSVIPFQTMDWSVIKKCEHKGETGTSYWQTLQLNGLRLRLVEYTKGYRANHWCIKSHIVHCIEGEFDSKLKDGTTFKLTKGMRYIVADNASSHRSYSANGVKLLIIDGDFLK